METRDRWAVLRAIELVTAHFGVGHKVKVKIMPIEKKCYAQYHSGEKCVHINSNMCDSVAMMVSSIFHEFTHAKQYARNEVPLHERYEPKEFRAYYFQFIELEARKYQIMLARQFIRLYANEIGSEFVQELENIEYMMQQQHYLMTN